MTRRNEVLAALFGMLLVFTDQANSADKEPIIISYNPLKFAPSTMIYQQVSGVLKSENNCVVLRQTNAETLLLNFTQPVELRQENNTFFVNHRGHNLKLGQTIALTGQLSGRWRDDWAQSQGIPQACRAFSVFNVM